MCKHCYDYNIPNHSDFIRGGVDAEDFDKKVNYKKKARKKPKPRGCPENDFNEHVYVWTTEHQGYLYRYMTTNREYIDTLGFARDEWLKCCGCGKVKTQRYTEEFNKYKNKVGWYKASYGHRNN